MKKRILCTLLSLVFCLSVCAAVLASGIERDEDGGIWDYDRGIYTDPTGKTHSISNDGDGGSGGSSTGNDGNAMIIDTGETDPMAGAKKNSDGSIEVESGVGGVDIEIEPTAAPLTKEEWEAEMAAVAARNGKDTPTVWTDPATGEAVSVEVVYMGIGRSMIMVNGEKKLVNTVDLKWETEAPENKALAVVRSRQASMRKQPGNKSLIIKYIFRDSVVRVLATGKNWSFVDQDGDRGYVITSALDFYTNDHTQFEGGYLSLNGKIKGKGRIQVRDPDTMAIIKDGKDVVFYQPGTPVTVFDILEDFDYAEIDVCGYHCVVMLSCLTLERSLTTASE